MVRVRARVRARDNIRVRERVGLRVRGRVRVAHFAFVTVLFVLLWFVLGD